jgi:hypothetical protein
MKLADRVKQQTATTGTGAYTLSGSADGFRTFAAVLTDGDEVTYCATFGTDYEVGIGTFTASGTTLSRDAVMASSNAGAAVDWAAGDKEIFITFAAANAPTYSASNPTVEENPPFVGAEHINTTTGERFVYTDGTYGANRWRGSIVIDYSAAMIPDSSVQYTNTTNPVVFDASAFDDEGGIVDLVDNRFVIPTGCNRAIVSFYGWPTVSSVSWSPLVTVLKNGTEVCSTRSSSSTYMGFTMTTGVCEVSAGDVFTATLNPANNMYLSAERSRISIRAWKTVSVIKP